MDFSVSQISAALGAYPVINNLPPQFHATALSWDSRTATPGSLFLALRGARADGNDYLLQTTASILVATRALTQAELAALAARPVACFIYAGSGAEALARLAMAAREELMAQVVGITGSSGKTSTKEMLAQIARLDYGGPAVVATAGNYNNELGMPFTLLQAGLDTRLLVLEMGMSGLGEIAGLAAVARPQIGAITNIGTAHLEQLGSQENVARAKSELISALPETRGVAVLPAESPYLGLIKQLAQVNARGLRVITFGLECSADVSAQNLRFDERACAHFDMQAIGFWQVPVSLGVPGKHQVYNALCAAACAWALDIDAQTIRDGLQSVVLPGQRLATRQLADGAILIDDAYNANPESVKASLDMLAAYAARSRKVAILGDMLELGPTSAQRHIEVGEQAAALGLDALICVGPAAADIAQGSRSAGMSQVLAFADFDAFKASIDQVRALIDRDTVLLLKASRGMRFEQITDLLTQD